MPFPKNDYYYDKELEDFYGEDIQKFDEEASNFMGCDGDNFTHDRYRRWLMKVLMANQIYTIKEAMEKYPFIKEDITHEEYDSEEGDYEEGDSEDENENDEDDEAESNKSNCKEDDCNEDNQK